MRNILCVLAFAVVAVSCVAAHSYPARNFTWTGDITPGATVRIRNVDGAIAVLASTTNKLTVDAVIVNAPPNKVAVKQAMSGNDIEFCTLLGVQGAGSCGEGKHGHSVTVSPLSFFSRHHPITVRYTLHVPAGVTVDV